MQTLANTDGKEIVTKHARSLCKEFGVTYLQIAEAMTRVAIPEDVKVLVQQLLDLYRS